MSENWSIPKSEFEQRKEKVQGMMREKGYDGLVIFSGYVEREGHVSYLTNHRSSFPNVQSHKGLGNAAYLLPREGEGVLICPFGYEQDKVLNIDDAKSSMNLSGNLKDAITEKNLEGKKLGVIGYDVIPAEYYMNLLNFLKVPKLDVLDSYLENMRAIKSESELKILREAAKVSDAGLQAAMETAVAGKHEYDIEIAARQASMQAGADYVARVRISTGKKMASLRWPMATGREMVNGDFVYIDFIGFYKGYGFDVQRIKVVGDATSEQKDQLNMALEAEDWLIQTIKPGKQINFVRSNARGFTIDPLAHGIGLDICEAPTCLLAGAKWTPEEHMVLCIEPGASKSGVGELALEDMVEVTKDGAKILNSYERKLW